MSSNTPLSRISESSDTTSSEYPPRILVQEPGGVDPNHKSSQKDATQDQTQLATPSRSVSLPSGPDKNQLHLPMEEDDPCLLYFRRNTDPVQYTSSSFFWEAEGYNCTEIGMEATGCPGCIACCPEAVCGSPFPLLESVDLLHRAKALGDLRVQLEMGGGGGGGNGTNLGVGGEMNCDLEFFPNMYEYPSSRRCSWAAAPPVRRRSLFP